MARIDAFLKLGVAQGCSDLHLAVGVPPMLRMHGDLMPIKFRELGEAELEGYITEVLTQNQLKHLREGNDIDFSYVSTDGGRFRVNVFRKETGMGAAFRSIPTQMPTMEQLGLPPIVRKLCDYHQGMILVTGSTGTGKSTTLASMIDYLNTTRSLNIISLEDPIEFVHRSQNCLIQHREVGIHTRSFAAALRGALREDPDLILVGEMRDHETIELALTAAATGHLVFGTLHTSSAAKAVDRIIDVFPTHQQNQIRTTLSESLKAVIAQNLFKTIDKPGRVAALEILVVDMAIANLIREGKTHQIPGMIQVGKKKGNQPLDDAIMEHLRNARISPEEAYDKSLDKKKFRQFLKEPPADASEE